LITFKAVGAHAFSVQKLASQENFRHLVELSDFDECVYFYLKEEDILQVPLYSDFQCSSFRGCNKCLNNSEFRCFLNVSFWYYFKSLIKNCSSMRFIKRFFFFQMKKNLSKSDYCTKHESFSCKAVFAH